MRISVSHENDVPIREQLIEGQNDWAPETNASSADYSSLGVRGRIYRRLVPLEKRRHDRALRERAGTMTSADGDAQRARLQEW